jgi:N-acetylneuraminic acid mutarotase
LATGGIAPERLAQETVSYSCLLLNCRLSTVNCRLLAILIALILSPPELAAGTSDRWEDLPPLATPRQEVGVAALDGCIYVIGGILESRAATGIVERYDIASARWESIAPLPDSTRIHHVGAAAAAGRVWCLGGLNSAFQGVRSVFAYDPATESWSPMADLPTARGASGVAVVGDRIFVAAGQSGGTNLRDFAAYTPATNTWEVLPLVPTARNHLAAAACGGIVYAISGRAAGLLTAMEAYDPVSRMWRARAPILTPRGGIAAAVLDGKIFVFGGEGNRNDPSGVFPQTEAYDPAANRWESRLDMANPRHGIGAAAVGDRIYIPGGSGVEGFGVTAVHDAFVPAPKLPEAEFLRGDANRDASVDISDPVFTLLDLFTAKKGVLPCPDAADSNDDGSVDLSDAVFSLDYLFRGGSAPPEPGPLVPGEDPTPDALDC